MQAIRSFNTLSSLEKSKLFSFFENHKGPLMAQNEEAVHSYMSMADLDYVSRFFSIWDEDSPTAALGLILAARSRKAEVYLVGAAAMNTSQSISAFETLVSHANTLATAGHSGVLKSRLGIGPGLSFLAPSVETSGYRLNESMLNLSLSGDALQASLNKDAESEKALRQVPLTLDNMDAYLQIHNASFQTVPNGGETSSEELRGWLDSHENNQWRGLLLDDADCAVAFYELSASQGVGWIDSIGIGPPMQGFGYGHVVLEFCIAFLVSRQCEEIDLNVMDSNVRAHRLYLKKGFTLKSIFNHWYQKELHAPCHTEAEGISY